MNLTHLLEIWDGFLFKAINSVSSILYLFRYFSLKRYLIRNKKLHNAYKGKRCFIVLNGPSINKHDLTPLKEEFVFASNYFFRSPLCNVIFPNFYCWLDAKVFFDEDGKDLMNELNKSCPDAKFFFNYKAASQIEYKKQYYYAYAKHISNSFGSSHNLSGISTNYFTVAFFAIDLAIYMGFEDIYLLGLDFEPGGFKHFTNLGEGTECLCPNEMDTKDEVCGLHWGYVKAQYESYNLADYAKDRGVRIINLNPQSCIRAFEFDNFNNIIKM